MQASFRGRFMALHTLPPLLFWPLALFAAMALTAALLGLAVWWPFSPPRR